MKKPVKPGKILTLPLDQLRPSLAQPRTTFSDEGINELAASITQHGVLQPILVKKVGDGYEIIAGERRWRAAKIAQLSRIPCLVMELLDEQTFAVALVENVQREDLNPIEEALAYKRLINILGLSQEEVAKRVGKERASISNTLRLLKLPAFLQTMVVKGELSMGHARALLALDSADMMMMVGKKLVREGLSVRRAEGLIRAIKGGENVFDDAKLPNSPKDPLVVEVQKKLQYELGLKTSLKKDGQDAYALTIFFQSSEQLNRLLETLAIEI